MDSAAGLIQMGLRTVLYCQRSAAYNIHIMYNWTAGKRCSKVPSFGRMGFSLQCRIDRFSNCLIWCQAGNGKTSSTFDVGPKLCRVKIVRMGFWGDELAEPGLALAFIHLIYTMLRAIRYDERHDAATCCFRLLFVWAVRHES